MRSILWVKCLLLVAGAMVSGFIVSRSGIPTAAAQAKPAATPRSKSPTRARRPPKFSNFRHDVKAHKMDCAKCHKFPSDNWKKVRAEANAFPDITDFPKHASCVSCHRREFFRGSPPAICSICHTNPSPRNSSRHPFPNPREVFDQTPRGQVAESDFDITFPHSTHVDIVSENLKASDPFTTVSWVRTRRFAEESCAVCHATLMPAGDSPEEYVSTPPKDLGDGFWLKKGTFKSSPIGHTTCFTCHNADSGLSPAPTDCAKCHTFAEKSLPADYDAALASRIGTLSRQIRETWSTRTSAGTFRHEFASHADLSCSTCHDVSKIETARQATKKVPIASCSMCHVTATADDGGALNYEVEQRKTKPAFQCSKCHISFGRQAIPASHTKAIEEAGK